MHEETYPAFFTPRDKEPSLSSSKEKSSEFDWLERKLTRKQEYKEETEQVLCSSITYMIYDILQDDLYDIGSKIYIEKIFSTKYPNNIFDWLQGENRNLHKISWEKKSNLVDGKYREASGEHYGTVQNSGNLKCRPQMLSGWTL